MLHFPADVNLLTRRPFIHFICSSPGRDAHIALPMPGSINFGDEATYNNAELGIIGNSVGSLAGQVSAGRGLEEISNSAIASIDRAAGRANIASIIQGVGALTGAPEGLQSAISIGTGTTLNKNITTEFTATNTRTFSFAFQLIARSESENTMIKAIVKAFRRGIYPEGDAFQLTFPPKWKINFRRGGSVGGGDEISDIPKIGEVYLQSVATVYNSAANMWRTDGSPLETTITVTFIETKAHTLESIDAI